MEEVEHNVVLGTDSVGRSNPVSSSTLDVDLDCRSALSSYPTSPPATCLGNPVPLASKERTSVDHRVSVTVEQEASGGDTEVEARKREETVSIPASSHDLSDGRTPAEEDELGNELER